MNETLTKIKESIIQQIPADQIIPPGEAMRTEIDRDQLHELAENIKQYGLINPITVSPRGDKYEIVAGNRRYLACGIAGIIRIPCVVRELSDNEVFAIKAAENLIRQDVDPVDVAIFIGKFVGNDNSKIDHVATLLGRSRAWVEDRLNILNYPNYFLKPLKDGKISLGVAKTLAKIGDEVYRKMFFENAVRDGMKQWQADYYLAQWEQGIFKNSEEIVPPSDDANPRTPPLISQRCAKCGGTAIAPNLTNVFIHVDCPPDGVTTANDTDQDNL